MDKFKSLFGKKAKPAHGPLTYKEMDLAARRRIASISREISHTFEFMKRYPRTVTILGSARFKETDPYYVKARRLSQRIVRELKYAIVTGGGPGIMEAANRGAYEAGGASLGMQIKLPHEQDSNQFLTAWLKFYYFFTRKVSLSFSAETYIFFPGGFGTYDEFFEIITLVQTRKIPRVPIILFGKDFWSALDVHIKAQLVDTYRTIDDTDRALYHITDNEDEIIDIIRKAPLRRE